MMKKSINLYKLYIFIHLHIIFLGSWLERETEEKGAKDIRQIGIRLVRRGDRYGSAVCFKEHYADLSNVNQNVGVYFMGDITKTDKKLHKFKGPKEFCNII